MKKIILLTTLIFVGFGFNINNTFASDFVNVRVTEKVPGANCTPIKNKDTGEIILAEDGKPAMYNCEVEKGAGAIVKMFGAIIKYFTFIAGLVGVLFIVYNGILYSMGGADQSLKEESKKRIIGTLVGLILLFLSGPILQIVAPWIYK